MRDYATANGLAKLTKTLQSQGCTFTTTDLGAGKTRQDLNIPKSATLSLRLWGGVDFLKRFHNVTLFRS